MSLVQIEIVCMLRLIKSRSFLFFKYLSNTWNNSFLSCSSKWRTYCIALPTFVPPTFVPHDVWPNVTLVSPIYQKNAVETVTILPLCHYYCQLSNKCTHTILIKSVEQTAVNIFIYLITSSLNRALSPTRRRYQSQV